LEPIEQEIVRRYIEELAELHSLMQEPEGPIGAGDCSAKDFPISWRPGACLTAHLLQSDWGKQLVGDGAKVNAQLRDTPGNPQELHMLALLLGDGEFTQAKQAAASQWVGEGAGEGSVEAVSGSGAAHAKVTGKQKKAAAKGGSGAKAESGKTVGKTAKPAGFELQVVSYSLRGGDGPAKAAGATAGKGGRTEKAERGEKAAEAGKSTSRPQRRAP
jgi:hypothetical protein